MNKERIILLVEERLFSLVNKDYSDWSNSDRLKARKELRLRLKHSKGKN